jgi:hypothetical protein
LQELQESPLKRNGTEVFLNGSKIGVDMIKLSKDLKKLSILRYPLFELYIKYAETFNEWDLTDAQIIKSPDVQGYRIIVNVYEPRISGEIVIAKRPLGQDEKGIAIMVGNHVVIRSTFGFDNKLSRVTGYVKCDQLTSRFADKSALIENDAYFRFNQSMKDFIVAQVLPSLTEYEDVLITREESKIYKEIDKVMGQAVLEMLQTTEEVEGFETLELHSSGAEEDSGGYDDRVSVSLLSSSPSPLTNERDSSSSSSSSSNYMADKEYSGNGKENWDENTNVHDIKKNSLKDGHGPMLSVPDESLGFVNGDSKSATGIERTGADNNGYTVGETHVNDSEIENRLLPSNEVNEQQQHLQHNTVCGTNDCWATVPDNAQNPPSSVFSQNEFDGEIGNMPNYAIPTKLGTDGNYPYLPGEQPTTKLTSDNPLIKKTIRKPVLKKTFALKK